ncbi:MAG: hypothetical protein QE278_06405 [Limnobacter sp.]|nr:hypothetical protein [Limnobacter sp.]
MSCFAKPHPKETAVDEMDAELEFEPEIELDAELGEGLACDGGPMGLADLLKLNMNTSNKDGPKCKARK